MISAAFETSSCHVEPRRVVLPEPALILVDVDEPLDPHSPSFRVHVPEPRTEGYDEIRLIQYGPRRPLCDDVAEDVRPVLCKQALSRSGR